jgi:hypothetical protein
MSFYFLKNFNCCLFKTGSHYVAQADLELMILLLQPSECWDYRCEPPYTDRDVPV